jgi:hypothetical protein
MRLAMEMILRYTDVYVCMCCSVLYACMYVRIIYMYIHV